MGKSKNKGKTSGFMLFYNEQCKKGPVKFEKQENKLKAAGHLWDQLPDADKEVYKAKAKAMTKQEVQTIITHYPIQNANNNNNNQQPSKSKGKLNSLGQSIDELRRIEQEKKDYQKQMSADLLAVIDNAEEMGNLNDLNFHFVSTSYFYYKKREGIFPAEFAMCKFSLRGGVDDEINFRINPGRLPLGASGEAMEIAEGHKYPLPKWDEEDLTDYFDIFIKILDLLSSSGTNEIPIIFARISEIESVEETLKTFLRKVNEEVLFGKFRVFPIEHLLFHLRRYTVQIRNKSNGTNDVCFPSIPFAKDQFKRGIRYDSPCEFHESKNEYKHCSLSAVRTYGYFIASYCCDFRLYESLPGKHCPSDHEIEMEC